MSNFWGAVQICGAFLLIIHSVLVTSQATFKFTRQYAVHCAPQALHLAPILHLFQSQ